jgi:hypothetical protein
MLEQREVRRRVEIRPAPRMPKAIFMVQHAIEVEIKDIAARTPDCVPRVDG